MAQCKDTQTSSSEGWMPPATPRALPLGQANIYPLGEPHAVSVSLPKWDSIIAQSRGEKWVVDQLEWSYPRFHINKPVQDLSDAVLHRLQVSTDCRCMVFASVAAASECLEALRRSDEQKSFTETVRFFMPAESNSNGIAGPHWANFSAVLLAPDLWDEAMAYWRDSGNGLSTRHAEYILTELDYLDSDCAGMLELRTPALRKRGGGICREIPASYQKIQAAESSFSELRDALARLASSNRPGEPPVQPDDVFLFPTGINAVYSLSECLAGSDKTATVAAFGWLYTETVGILRRGSWGEVLSYKSGSEKELESLAETLRSGKKVHALFCEFPSNILLSCPDLRRLRELADEYGFIIACDDSVVGYVNLDALPFVDVMVSSLTKTFSGSSNVMGGSLVVNPSSKHRTTLRSALSAHHKKAQITYFPLDAATLLANNKTMHQRIKQCNENTLPLVRLVSAHPSISAVHHPSTAPTAHNYEAMMRKTEPAGYGNILSIVFRDPRSAEHFFNVLQVCKGSSFGTNFTVAVPYVHHALYSKREKVPRYGVPAHIIRVSVGLEDGGELVGVMEEALREVERFEGGSAGARGVEDVLN
ncbi:Cys metabolizm PLP-dependent enzyme [Aspergillus mulundensis]|uniref:Cys metabolizm PLP-dependent enzyme n=1 Tax=Aspergillus mulundensis TaxID=1810919 RepID=A0A3D8RXI3_9EURO|nr:Cys metabolizm PLP-dependent enzyme [Aspergillus mulundensis]RDW78706.1 Cys metabolizm PLP-dependent enzyme [Aspergillus mulundensis]